MQPMIEGDIGPFVEQAAATGTDPAGYLSEAPASARSRSRTASCSTPTRRTRAALDVLNGI